MSLPVISYPIHELNLPSTNQTIKFRPFLVKEEKILLLAQSSENMKEIIDAVKTVISNCILTEDVVIDDLTTFDLEYLFLKIRARSVNNIVSLTYRDLDDEKKYTVEVNLDEVEVIKDTTHTNKVEIDDNSGIIMKYPKADLSNAMRVTEGELDVFFDIVKNCIEKVYVGDKLYFAKDYSEEELEEFVTSLSVGTFNKIQEFFTTMPKLYHEIKYTNSLGTEKVIPLTNINDFFSLG